MSEVVDSMYAGIYADVAEIIGEEKIDEFFHRFQGQQIVFPMKLYSKEYVISEARNAKGKRPIAEMAQEFGYSERYLRKLLAERE